MTAVPDLMRFSPPFTVQEVEELPRHICCRMLQVSGLLPKATGRPNIQGKSERANLANMLEGLMPGGSTKADKIKTLLPPDTTYFYFFAWTHLDLIVIGGFDSTQENSTFYRIK